MDVELGKKYTDRQLERMGYELIRITIVGEYWYKDGTWLRVGDDGTVIEKVGG